MFEEHEKKIFINRFSANRITSNFLIIRPDLLKIYSLTHIIALDKRHFKNFNEAELEFFEFFSFFHETTKWWWWQKKIMEFLTSQWQAGEREIKVVKEVISIRWLIYELSTVLWDLFISSSKKLLWT